MCGNSFLHSGWGETALKDIWGDKGIGGAFNEVRLAGSKVFDTVGLGAITDAGNSIYRIKGSRPDVEQRSGRQADNQQARLLAYQKQQYAPFAPEDTLGVIQQNEEIRNRRRRAVLLGVDQLRTASGPGAASGGGYGGANTPYA